MVRPMTGLYTDRAPTVSPPPIAVNPRPGALPYVSSNPTTPSRIPSDEELRAAERKGAKIDWDQIRAARAAEALDNDAAQQGQRRTYYEGREAGADQNSDRAYDAYTGRSDQLANEARDQVIPTDPGFQGYDQFVEGAGNLYGERDGGDLSQYGEKDYYGGDELADVDPNSRLGRLLSNYESNLAPQDYSAYFTQLAGAANDQLTQRIKQQTLANESTAAGRGRLSSSIYDYDQGSLYQGLAADTRADLARGALEAAQFTQRDRESSRDAGAKLIGSTIDALDLNRRNTLERGQAAADAGYKRASLAASNREDARRAYESDRGYSTDVFRDNRDTALGYAERQRDFRKGLYDDQYGAAVDRSGEAYKRAEDQRGEYRDLEAGNADRYQGILNEKKRNKSNTIGSIISGIGSVARAVL